MMSSLAAYANHPVGALNVESRVVFNAGDVAIMRHFHDPLVMPIVNLPFVSFSLRCRFKWKGFHRLLVDVADVVDLSSADIISRLADHAQFNPRLISHIKQRSGDYGSWFAIMIHVYDTEPGIHDVDFIRVASHDDFVRRKRHAEMELLNVIKVGKLVMCSSHNVSADLLDRKDDNYLHLLSVMSGHKRMKEVS